jgi:plastocyanin
MKIGNLALLLACVAMTGLPACGSDDDGGGGRSGTGGGGTGATGGSSGGTGGSGATGGSTGGTGGSTGGAAGATGGAAGGGGTAGSACVTGTGAEVVDCAGGTPAATVDIQDYSFTPATTTVSVGEIVKFDNSGSFTHTATSGTPPACIDGNFDTGNITADSSKCVKFNVAGDYPFFCMVHNTMTGTITVN